MGFSSKWCLSVQGPVSDGDGAHKRRIPYSGQRKRDPQPVIAAAPFPHRPTAGARARISAIQERAEFN
jgi:hypothetical protein